MISLSRCIIITSFQSSDISEFFSFEPDDFIICADGGYLHAKNETIMPDVVIGDFDSIDLQTVETELKNPVQGKSCTLITVAAEKDDTDTMICLKYGMERGFEDFFILGGLGGRLDHTVANLQTMAYAVDQGKSIWCLDGKNRATVRNPGMLSVPKIEGYKISLFSFGENCEGVSIGGVKYPLYRHLLHNRFPLGVSNEFLENKAEISHEKGKLLVVLSHD